MNETPRFYKTSRLVSKQVTPVDKKHGHQQLNPQLWNGRITGTFTNLQPLHVGTGLFVPPKSVGIESDVPLVKSFHQVDGRLTIPGSSLKGPIRSLVEMITNSCVNKTQTRLDREEYGECRYDSQRHQGEICLACKLFGAMGYQGQLFFADAPLITGNSAIDYIPPQYQPRGRTERRYYPHDLQDDRVPKWPLEVAQPNSRFSFQVRYENVTAAELGLLLLALGAGTSTICLKIGAGKSSGLGAIRFENHLVQRLDVPSLYRVYDSQTAWQAVDVAACLEASASLTRPEALSRLQADLDCSQILP